MNEKDLRKLRRQDLLELLLLQSREAARLQEQLAESTARNDELRAERARLTKWLEDKDAKLAQLQSQLEENDTKLAVLQRASVRLYDRDSGKAGDVELQALANAFRDALAAQLTEPSALPLRKPAPSRPLNVFKKRLKRS